MFFELSLALVEAAAAVMVRKAHWMDVLCPMLVLLRQSAINRHQRFPRNVRV